MQVFQTIGEPPSSGSTILATMGWTRNNRKALTNSVDVNSGTMSMVGARHGASTIPPKTAIR